MGARPQFIKAATVSRVLSDRSDISEFIVHTGQHFDANMSAVFFQQLELPQPDCQLGIGGGSHGAMTGRQLEQIEQVLLEQRPDWVLVYGDTNSTLAGALAAVKLHLPVAHVEAGLRSFNRAMPEEINRVVADHVAELLLVPTELARENLRREGVNDQQIVYSGDVMYDAALFYGRRAAEHSRILDTLNLVGKRFLLVTVHRAENTDNPERLRAIVDALLELAGRHRLVWPLHPRARAALRQAGLLDRLAHALSLIEPVGYLDMVMLERSAALIATDSGGVQKEAYFHRVPCVTWRTETEWRELLDSGWNRLAAPHDPAAMVAAVEQSLKKGDGGEYRPLYGDGNAAQIIVDELLSRAG